MIKRLTAKVIIQCLALLLITGLALAADSVLERTQIEERDGRTYKISDPSPYTGLVVSRFGNGKVQVQERYENGKVVEFKQWYANGKLAEELSVKDNAWTRKFYGETGVMEEESVVVVKDSKKLSESTKLWYENGKPKLEISFVAEKLHGRIKEYDQSGNVLKEEVYENGKLVKKVK